MLEVFRCGRMGVFFSIHPVVRVFFPLFSFLVRFEFDSWLKCRFSASKFRRGLFEESDAETDGKVERCGSPRKKKQKQKILHFLIDVFNRVSFHPSHFPLWDNSVRIESMFIQERFLSPHCSLLNQKKKWISPVDTSSSSSSSSKRRRRKRTFNTREVFRFLNWRVWLTFVSVKVREDGSSWPLDGTEHPSGRWECWSTRLFLVRPQPSILRLVAFTWTRNCCWVNALHIQVVFVTWPWRGWDTNCRSKSRYSALLIAALEPYARTRKMKRRILQKCPFSAMSAVKFASSVKNWSLGLSGVRALLVIRNERLASRQIRMIFRRQFCYCYYLFPGLVDLYVHQYLFIYIFIFLHIVLVCSVAWFCFFLSLSLSLSPYLVSYYFIALLLCFL